MTVESGSCFGNVVPALLFCVRRGFDFLAD
jgi:hypothetical protein